MKNDAIRTKIYTVLKCRKCGLEKMKIRERKTGSKNPLKYGKCVRCFLWEFDEIKVTGLRERCVECSRLVVVDFKLLKEWRNYSKCVECGGAENMKEIKEEGK